MLRNRLYIIMLALMTVITAAAQHDCKAKAILDEVAFTYEQSNGMKIIFNGTQSGTLWLKGDCFVLECAGVKSWFDGATQWSYVAENEEVNISSPTPEELRAVNPYSLLTMYRKGFSFQYEGNRVRQGKQGAEILLMPDKKGDIRKFIVIVDANHIPVYIGVDMENGHYEEFVVQSCEKMPLPSDFFRFDKSHYPDAEVIDLR